MIVKTMVLIVSALTDFSDTYFKKISTLQSVYGDKLLVIIHANCPTYHYIAPVCDGEIDIKSCYEQKVSAYKKEISFHLNLLQWNSDILVHWEQQLSPKTIYDYINTSFNDGSYDDLYHSKDHIIIFLKNDIGKNSCQHLLYDLNNTVLILSEHAWPAMPQLKMILDPRTQYDISAEHIIKQSKKLSKAITGQLTLLYHCYIPHYFSEFKNWISSRYFEKLEHMMSDHEISYDCVEVLKSPPKKAVENYVSVHHADIIVMPNLLKEALQKLYIASVNEYLLQEKFSKIDILLIRS